ncbi:MULTISPECIES: type II toxin-antitoxin system HicB family antitoxin [unclassified Roseitalea]|uniref:type II toxin-antitoxin system HicB family antitoxin n=1 Tax=unclassified Roseitalea TaxID=2639107 RepID=UPI00273F9E3F|nr:MULTISPECIES: type II toxin-antitoxin system HicB family antitoxin [unclassified Roseitalea]
MRYPALIDGTKGAYGVVFPDLDGVVAMGTTIDEALLNAEEALRDYVLETEADGLAIAAPTAPEAVVVPPGSSLVLVPLIRLTGRTVRANLTLDEGVAAFIDEEARRRNMTRVSFIEWMARRVAADGV